MNILMKKNRKKSVSATVGKHPVKNQVENIGCTIIKPMGRRDCEIYPLTTTCIPYKRPVEIIEDSTRGYVVKSDSSAVIDSTYIPFKHETQEEKYKKFTKKTGIVIVKK